MRLIDFLREIDKIINKEKYTSKISVSSIIDSFTGEPLLTSATIRNITDYDYPVDIVIVEHPQGQWMDTVIYINVTAMNDFRTYCLLDSSEADRMLRSVISDLRSVSENPNIYDLVDIIREWIDEECPVKHERVVW